MDAISDIVKTAIPKGNSPTLTAHGLGWSLCAGTTHASLQEDMEVFTRIGDTVATRTASVSASAAPSASFCSSPTRANAPEL
ncbi:hypothetical protein ATN37_01075 [Rhodococcus sp. MH15]|nr:hypothetical protein [Rhodococcus sp. MH15]